MPGTTELGYPFTDSYKHMECLGGMTLQSFLTNGYFGYPCNAGYPQLVYTNKTGDCLFIYLFICSPMDGQTARPNGLKVGG